MKPIAAIALASTLTVAMTAAWPASAAPLRLSDFSSGRVVVARADDARDQRNGRGTDDRINAKAKGADDPAGDVRRGRHADDVLLKSKGADDPAGDMRRGRHADDVLLKSKGADDPAGDVRRGRHADDGANHR